MLESLASLLPHLLNPFSEHGDPIDSINRFGGAIKIARRTCNPGNGGIHHRTVIEKTAEAMGGKQA